MTPTDYREHEERAAMESVRRSNGVLSIPKSDRTRGGLISALSRLVRHGTVSEGTGAEQSRTFRLLRPKPVEQSHSGQSAPPTDEGRAPGLASKRPATASGLLEPGPARSAPQHAGHPWLTAAPDGSRLSEPGPGRRGRRAVSPVDLWKKLEQTTLDLLRTKGGALTIDTTDRSQRNLLLTLERLVGTRTVARVITAKGPLATYQLRQ
jgi:hypothetical protein